MWFIIRNVCLVFGFWHRVPKVTIGINCAASDQDVFCYVNKAAIEKCLKVEVLVDSRPYQVELELSFLPPHLLGGDSERPMCRFPSSVLCASPLLSIDCDKEHPSDPVPVTDRESAQPNDSNSKLIHKL